MEVYNALNDTNYTDPDAVEVVDLDKGVSLSVRNDASFEVICRIYNINPPFNEDLKERSEVLWGYTCFVEKVRAYQRQGKKVGEAVETAIDECINEHILKDFFLARKDEVMKMTHLDYTWEKREKMIRKEEYEDGVKVGEARGIDKVAANMLAQNMSEEMILQLTGLTLEGLQRIRSIGDV
ncbi:MAG: hypothetical protein ACI4FY_03680 [Acetatifactor sp.]